MKVVGNFKNLKNYKFVLTVFPPLGKFTASKMPFRTPMEKFCADGKATWVILVTLKPCQKDMRPSAIHSVMVVTSESVHLLCQMEMTPITTEQNCLI